MLNNIIKNRLRFIETMLFIIAVFIPNILASDGNFEAECLNSNLLPKDKTTVTVFAKVNDETVYLDSCKFEVKFDCDKLKYNKLICKNEIKRSHLKTEKGNGTLSILYSPRNPCEISHENNKSAMFDLEFTVKSKVPVGVTEISISAIKENSDNTENIPAIPINIIEHPEVKNCRLKELTPSEGHLSPSFDPNIFNYSLDVPAESKYLDLNTDLPENSNLSLKINRRKLLAAGQITDINVTVKNNALKVKFIYNIKVHRALPAQASSNKSINSRSKNNNENKIVQGSGSKSEKTLSKKSSSNKLKTHKSKGSGKSSYSNDTEENEAPAMEGALDSTHFSSEDTAETLILKNDNFKIYIITAFSILVIAAGVYFTLRYFKSKKNTQS